MPTPSPTDRIALLLIVLLPLAFVVPVVRVIAAFVHRIALSLAGIP